ncbi:MAG TPA: hypothetical protein VFY29_13915 [Terriglobia bacterium]|nr:hypothetical protein [Terriglobia bacterium]
MKRLFHAVLWLIFCFMLVSGTPAAAQQIVVNPNPIQTGFAVVTPLPGSGDGLNVSELFSQEVGGAFYRSTVLPSPLVTLTSVIIASNPNAGVNTGIAIVNPGPGTATVRLILNNDQGGTVGSRVITIGRIQQISRFITELFPDVPVLAGPFGGLLFIEADVPVGVLGLGFVGPSFATLPIATQLNGSSVAIGALTGTTGAATSQFVVTPAFPSTPFTPVSPTIPTVAPPLPVQITPVSPGAFAFVPSPPIVFPSTPLAGAISVPGLNIGFPVSPITGPSAPLAGSLSPPFPTPLSTFPITGPSVNLGSATGIAAPLAGSPTPTLLTSTIPPPTVSITGPSANLGNATGPSAPLVGNVSPTAAGGIATMPVIATGIGGPLSRLLAQVATGGGWVSVVVVANTSAVDQFVRVDFFSSEGGPLQLPFGSSVPALFVPAGGVATVSTQ